MHLPKPGEYCTRQDIQYWNTLLLFIVCLTSSLTLLRTTVCGRLLPTKANKMEGKMLPALVMQLIGRFHEVSMR